MEENAKGLHHAVSNKDNDAAKAYLTDLYDYFRMDSTADPVILFEQFCCVLAPLQSNSGLIVDPENSNTDDSLLVVRWYEELIDKYCSIWLGWNVSVSEEFKNRPELIRRMLAAARGVMAYVEKGSVLLGPLLSGFLETVSQARRSEIIATPIHTAREIVKVLYHGKQTAFWGKVLDPACGSGAFLIALLEQLKEEDSGTHLDILGLERDEHLRSCVAMLAYFYQYPLVSIETKDGGPVPEAANEEYDLILANPPFRTQSLRDREKFGDDARLPVRTNDIHRAFIQRTLMSLKPGGKCAVIVPDSFLSHTASDAIQVRQWILEKFQCTAVVKLPYYSFFPQAAVNASVLFIRRPDHFEKLSPAEYRIFFFAVEEDGRSNDTRRRPVPRNDFDELRQVWDQRDMLWAEWSRGFFTQNVHGMPAPEQWDHPHFWFGRLEDIRRNDYSLLPERYQPVRLLSGPVQDPEEILDEMRELGAGIMELMEQLAEAEYEW